MDNDSSFRIVAALREWIAGRAPGARLPTSRMLVAEYEASPVTVQKALRTLVAQGLIETRPGAGTNPVYVFIYEYDPTGASPTRWSCPACAAASGRDVRTPGHQRVVVDLKLKWQPVLAAFLGIPAAITFDAQTVARIEF